MKKKIQKPKEEDNEEIGTCSTCDEPDFDGYHKAWCPEG